MTLTNRLTLFFLAALAAVLVSFSGALYALAHHYLHRNLDDQLTASARTIASAAEVEPDGVEWEPHNRPMTLASGTFGDQLVWAVTDDTGHVIDRSSQADGPELMAAADGEFQTGHRNLRRVEHDDRAWQAARLRLEPAVPPLEPLKPKMHRALVVTVAVPLGPVRGALRALAAALTALTLVVLVVASFAGRGVCRRALAPVARMADVARSMGAADLTERLPGAAADDELADLARAFNGLLDRLGETLARERRFAGEASHQLRTPLTALIGQVEVALRRDRDPDEYRRALGSALDQAGRLRRVVEALLFLARSESDAKLPGVERIELAMWFPARLAGRADAARGTDLVFEPPGADVSAVVHPDLFGELLDALIDNALKYSEPGTSVVIRVGCDSESVWAEVEDRGSGIASADLPHLFRPFFRSEEARRRGIPGVGLGLAVAARIAAALGGSLGVATEVGRGSRFRVTLPTFAPGKARVEPSER